MEKLKSPEIIFVIFAFVFGIIIMFITPKYEVPDEMAHLLRAKEVANGVIYNNLPENRDDGYAFHGASGYPPVMYVFSGLGNKLGSLSGNQEIAFYFGRFFNLLIWITLTYFAIKITPIFKWQFLFASLMPMSIYLGSSYSGDAFNNGFAFLFFAYIFKIIFEQKDISLAKDTPRLLISSIIGGLCKCAIMPLFLLLPIKLNKHKKILILLIILISIASSCLWYMNNYSNTGPAVDSDFNKHFILSNPIGFFKLFCTTCIHYLPNWSGQVIGKLGLNNIRLSTLFYRCTMFYFILSLVFIPEKYTINLFQRIYSALLFFGFVFFTCCLLFITWTPLHSAYIQGIQGRYFIAVLPFLFILCKPNIKNISINTSSFMKKALIVYIFLMLIYCVGTLYNVYY